MIISGEKVASSARISRRPLRRLLKRPPTAVGIGALCWLILAALVLAQLVLLVISSFKPDGLLSFPGFTLDNYRAVYESSQTYSVLGNTLIFGLGSTIFALIVGALLGFIVERTDAPGARILSKLVLIPLAIPGVLLAMSWAYILSPHLGLINSAASALGVSTGATVFSLPGMTFVQGLGMVPFAYLLLLPSLRSMNPSLEEAARVSGARFYNVLRYIVAPLSRPAMIAVFTFCLIISCVAFDIPALLGIPGHIYTIGSNFWMESEPSVGLPAYGEISATGVSLIVILLFLAWYYQRSTRAANRFVTISGKPTGSRRFSLGRWRYGAAALTWVYVFVSSIGPLLVLLLSSFQPYYSPLAKTALSSYTLRNYTKLFETPEFSSSTLNTLIVAVCTSTAVVLIGSLVSWAVVKSGVRGSRLLDSVAVAPVAMPGVVMGVMLISTFLSLPEIPVYGTIWIIVIGSVVISLPFATRVIGSAFIQIDRELEEAARISAATVWRTVLHVTVALARPAMIVAWVWTATLVVRELALPLMVQSGSNSMFVTMVWNLWNTGQYNAATAGAVVLVAVLLAGVTVWLVVEGRLSARAQVRR